MLLTFLEQNNKEQSADFKLQMSQAELSFLVNFAIESLIQIGAVAVQTNTTEPQEIKLPIPSTSVIPDIKLN